MQPSFVALAFKPFRDTFVFSGRSRRTEVVAFFILGMLANSVTIAFGSGRLFDLARLGWQVLWAIPWVALLVRRLHDQNRSANWAGGLVAAFVALAIVLPLLPQSVDSTFNAKLFIWTFHPTGPLAIVYGVAIGLLAVTTWVLYLLPERSGADRYGPDPRLDPSDEREPIGSFQG
jgi:uncharacterized membrane protein YhaH (DUF805 family)